MLKGIARAIVVFVVPMINTSYKILNVIKKKINMQTIKLFQNIKIDENNKQLMKSQKMNKKKHIRFKLSNSNPIS
jgi:hypothetical protein